MTDSASWPERYAATALGWDTTPNPLVVAACSKLPPGRALDLGAGEGRDALWLAGRGWTVTAVDVSQLVVGRLLSHAALQGLIVDAIAADAVSYRPASGRYDLILLSYLELPVLKLKKVLASAIPGLRSGGRLLVIAHDASNIDEGFGGPPDPDLLTTPERVARWLDALGLEVRRAEVVRREVVVDVGVRHVCDHVVEAVRPTGGVPGPDPGSPAPK